MSNSRVHHFKLVLLGDTAVGKSCLVVRFVRDEFFEFQEPTIGGKMVASTAAVTVDMKRIRRHLRWNLAA
jgi:GTPase SAR1 family protein